MTHTYISCNDLFSFTAATVFNKLAYLLLYRSCCVAWHWTQSMHCQRKQSRS